MVYNVGIVSYTVAAVLYFLLTALLIANWRGRILGFMLVSVASAMAVWAAVSAYYASIGRAEAGGLVLMDLLRGILWIGFLVKFFQVARHEGESLRVSRPLLKVLAVLGITGGLFLGAAYWSESVMSVVEFGDTAVLVNVLLAVTGLVLMENMFRNVHPDKRWAIKHLFLGLGTLFVYDLFLFSDALLFHRIDETLWAARGGVNAIAVPLIMVSAARNPHWSLDLFVSRKIAFHTVTLTGAGAYLLIMAAGGYYVRHVGGSWGSVAQIVFLFGALVLLLAILFSGQIRASINVFLNKHFFNYKYDYREEWLRFINRLSSESFGSHIRENAIRAIADIVDSTGGVLWLRRDPNGYVPITSVDAPGVQAQKLEGEWPMVESLQGREWIINLDEYRNAHKGRADEGLPEWLRDAPRGWLVVPLLLHKELFGFVLLLHPRAHRSLNWEDYDFLRLAGFQAASYLSQYESSQLLVEARQFETLNRLSAFIIHDLKNLIGQLSLLVENAKRHKDNPLFVDDMIKTVQNSVGKMNRLLVQLRSGKDYAHELSVVDLSEVVGDAIASSSSRSPVPVLQRKEPGLCLRVNRDRLVSVFEHILQNAQEATGEHGQVEVSLYRDGGSAIISVSDNGRGMDEEFVRDRLFMPFDTTKGEAGMGIGAYESREFVRSLGGAMDVKSRPMHGTSVRISIPLEGVCASDESRK